MKFCFTLSLLFVLWYVQGSAQTITIYNENFSSYGNCTTQNAPTWTTTSADADDGSPGCNAGQSYWGVFNGEFRCNDIEGPGSNNLNTFTTQAFNIQCYSNVTVSFTARHTGTMECGGGAASHDEIVGYYSINGGAWVQFANICGSNSLPGTFSVNGLSGNTIAIQITTGNKANDENYYFDNILITGQPPQFANAGADQNICAGNTAQLNATGGVSYQWNASPSLSCTGCANPIASPSGNAQYIVTVTDANGCTDKDTVQVNMLPGPVVNLGNDTSICGSASVVLNAGNPGATYLWQNSSTSQTFTATGSGTYHVAVTSGGCTDRDTIQIGIQPLPAVNLGNDTTICGNIFLPLNVAQAGATYLWQNGSANSTFLVNQPGTYYVRVTNSCGSVSDTLHVYPGNQPVANLGNDTLVCGTINIPLNVAQAGATYLWQNGSANSTFLVNQPGTYYVRVTNGCGSISDTIHVQQGNLPVADLSDDTLVCGVINLPLNVAQTGATYLWQNSSTSSSFLVNQPGTYYVRVTNSCGSVSDTIHVQQGSLPAVDLGNDTMICGAVNIPLNVAQAGATYLWQNGSAGSFFTINQPGTYHVRITNSCGSVSDTIHVIQQTAPVVDLGNDTLTCGSVNILLNAGNPGSQYLWQNSSTLQTFQVNAPGTYYVRVINACGQASDTIHITPGSIPQVNLGADQVLCTGATVLLDATHPDALGYDWQDNSTGASFSVSAPGMYYVTLLGSCGNVSDTIHFTAPYPLDETLGLIEGGCTDDSVTVSLEDEFPGADFLWSTGETTSSVTIGASGNYYVTVSFCGESVTDSFQVSLKGSQMDEIFLPNAFTPNGDSINDTYSIHGIFDNTVGFRVNIFNRWGAVVFSSNHVGFQWDGTFSNQPVPEGTYYLVVDMRKECEVMEDVTKSTLITLLR